jgi:ferric-dicitrate binding protein FerR (iron transport regulator)
VSGTASEDEKILVDQWYELLYNENTLPLNGTELESIEQEMWDKLKQEGGFERNTTIRPATPVRKLIIRWAAAAAVFAGISFGIYEIYSSQPKPLSYHEIKEQNKLTELINDGSETKKVQLEDGTEITLQPSSRLSYPGHFTVDKREVYLDGEAFFNVAKDPAKPFLVHSGNLVTQVLGTSFTIKPDKNSGKIIVSVKTGKVAVFEDNNRLALNSRQKKNNGAIITPNQSVIYDIDSRNFITQLVDNPQPVLPESGEGITAPPLFVFDDTNLNTVLENLAKTYAVEILVENENIYKCRFTGDITRQPLYDKLDLICQSTNHQYEIKGTKILIKGKGCN